MRNLKQVVIAGIVGILLIQCVFLVSAQEVEPPNFFDKLLRLFSESSFTIVGQDNHASVNPDETWYINPSATFSKTKSQTNSLCNGNSGFYNVFARLPNDNTWYERFELIDDITVSCVSSNQDCIIELYCMPYDYPPSNTDCNSWESGSQSATKTATDPLMPLLDFYGDPINTYTYCTEGCTGNPITCWRVNGDECQSRQYSCGYETYPNCPTSWSYTSRTTCEDNIPSEDCSGKDPSDCMSDSGCIVGLYDCIDLSTASCSDIQSEPFGSYTASEICAKKSGCVVDGGSCKSSGGGNGGGGEEDLDALIYDITYPSLVKPGQENIEIKFKVKNKGPSNDYLIETGIIPKPVAKDWGFSFTGDTFSIFDWNRQTNTECCTGQKNIFAKTTKLNTDEIDEFKITIPKAPYDGIGDLCYDNKYWNGSGEYVLYITIKTGCYPEGEEVTYETKIINVLDSSGDVAEGQSISLSNDEWESATPRMIVAAMCEVPSDCSERILEDGTILKGTCISSSEIEKINKNAVQRIKESAGESALTKTFCGDGKIGLDDLNLVGVVKGAAWFVGGSYFWKSLCNDESLEIKGTCRLEEKPFDIGKYLKEIGEKIKITGNPTTDGIIVIIGGFIMVMVLLNLVSRKK